METSLVFLHINERLEGATLCKYNASQLNEGNSIQASDRTVSFSQVQEEVLLNLHREPNRGNDLKK